MPSPSGVVVPLASDPKKETKEVAVEKKVPKEEKPSQPKIHEDQIRPHPAAAPSGTVKTPTPVVSEATLSPTSSGSGIFD